jgi:hypothetical protein
VWIPQLSRDSDSDSDSMLLSLHSTQIPMIVQKQAILRSNRIWNPFNHISCLKSFLMFVGLDTSFVPNVWR